MGSLKAGGVLVRKKGFLDGDCVTFLSGNKASHTLFAPSQVFKTLADRTHRARCRWPFGEQPHPPQPPACLPSYCEQNFSCCMLEIGIDIAVGCLLRAGQGRAG